MAQYRKRRLVLLILAQTSFQEAKDDDKLKKKNIQKKDYFNI